MRWTRADEIDVATRRWLGHKVASIARAVGRDEFAVSARLSHLSIVTDPFKRRRRAQGKLIGAVKGLLAVGRTVTEIADRLSVDRSVVSRYRKRLGHPPCSRRDVAPGTRRVVVGGGPARTVGEYGFLFTRPRRVLEDVPTE